MNCTSQPARPHHPNNHGQAPLPVLDYCLQQAYIHREDWEKTPEPVRRELEMESDARRLMERLVTAKLLTHYQVDRIVAGTVHGLMLGSYRILDRLGVGGMGVVFLAEHLHLRRLVAIKMLPLYGDSESDNAVLPRFFNEIRVIAQLQHPNIVWAIDTGEIPGDGPDSPVLYYHVMEYVPGKDLEELVQAGGPLSLARACDLTYQIASALVEADKHALVHRDIKPSNVLVTPEGQAKLLDFGLARCSQNRHTALGMLLGTLDYVAPEQARDASSVDIRADIYSLGGTLVWALTGKVPFPSDAPVGRQITARLTQAPPVVSRLRPDIPAELDVIIARMMATNPADRFPTPQAVMRAFLPFLRAQANELPYLGPESAPSGTDSLLRADLASSSKHRVLIVDGQPRIRTAIHAVLESEGFACDEAVDGTLALEMARSTPYDLLILGVELPGLRSDVLVRRLREAPPTPNVKLIMVPGRAAAEDMSSYLSAGADDYILKPFAAAQLVARVRASLRVKEAQDRSDAMAHWLRDLNQQLEQSLRARDSDLIDARHALTLAVAELVAYRGFETSAHLNRMQAYARILAERAATTPTFAGKIDARFIQLLESTAPLHDVGMIGLPDNVLLKPGALADDERIHMRTHTTLGADILQRICRQRGFDVFLQMAIDVTRYHHERWDGRGYPDHLAGEDIPLAARCVAIGDVYDALRSRRPHKPALSHAAAVAVMIESSQGQFDPALLQVFQACSSDFDHVFRTHPDDSRDP